MGWLLRRAFGIDSSSDKRLIEASLVQYVNSEAPPFLILHGKQDTAVPVEHAQALYQKLLDAGADAKLVIVENANHNFKPTGGLIIPTRADISNIMGDFFTVC
jgi:dipeptidyl aminopeptidase/acylaminoacyl peptidase